MLTLLKLHTLQDLSQARKNVRFYMGCSQALNQNFQ